MKGVIHQLLMSKEAIVNSVVMPAYIDKYIIGPRCIMELSMRDWNRMKSNAIHLNGYLVSKIKKPRVVTYNDIINGNNVKPIKKCIRVMMIQFSGIK